MRGAGGVDLEYNGAAERVKAYFGTTRREEYVYDLDGHLIETWSGSSADGNSTSITGAVKQRGSFTYDLMGRLTAQTDFEANGTTPLQPQIEYNNNSDHRRNHER